MHRYLTAAVAGMMAVSGVAMSYTPAQAVVAVRVAPALEAKASTGVEIQQVQERQRWRNNRRSARGEGRGFRGGDRNYRDYGRNYRGRDRDYRNYGRNYRNRDRGYRDYGRNYRNDRRYRDYGRYYGDRGYRYRDNDSFGSAAALGVFGLAAGAIIGSQLGGYGSYGGNGGYDYHDACSRRYRSYDSRSGTFLGYDGYRHQCRL